MKINTVSLFCTMLILCILAQHAQAHNRFFWLINIKSDLRIILHGLVSLNQSENEQSATLHHINNSLTGYSENKDSKGSSLPKPLCMDHITHHDWGNTPVRRVTFRGGIYGVENIPRKLGGWESFILAITVVGLFAVPYMTEGQYYHGVEIPSTNASARMIIPNLCTVGETGVSFGSHSTQLENLLNSALKKATENNQCLGIQHENSLLQMIHLLTENQYS